MAQVYVETNLGDRFFIESRSAEFHAGKTIMSFIISIELYCPEPIDDDVKEWFDELNRYLKQTFCVEADAFIKSIYAGNYFIDRQDYNENKYDMSIEDSSFVSDDEEYLAQIRRAKQAWQPVEQVLQSVLNLLKGFNQMESSPRYFYVPEYTPRAFQLLEEALRKTIDQKASKVRLCLYVE